MDGRDLVGAEEREMISRALFVLFESWIVMLLIGASYHWGWTSEPRSFGYCIILMLVVEAVYWVFFGKHD